MVCNKLLTVKQTSWLKKLQVFGNTEIIIQK